MGRRIVFGDFAADPRETIRAISRLPFDGDRLVELLCHSEATAANHPEDEDYTAFWLVVADQICRRGIVSQRARDEAFSIIEPGRNLEVLSKLGGSASALRKRQRDLEELRKRLEAQPAIDKKRPVLRQPQRDLMEIGDVFVYPTSGGGMINPYFRTKDEMPDGWHPDGWGAMILVDRGRAFGFIAW